MTGFLPWHEPLRQRLFSLRRGDRLPHAMLLSGPKHVGKREFAAATAAFLLCQQPTDRGHCGTCDNCLLFAAGTQPDFQHLLPWERKSGKPIRIDERRLIIIDQVRDMIEWAGQTAQRGGMKVVIIQPAEQMNNAAANALLKCLEEPTSGMLLMLVSDTPGRLLPTIRSRCQHLDFVLPERDQSLEWLARECPERDADTLSLLLSIAGGAPLAVTVDFDDAYLARRQEVASAVEQLVRGGNPLSAASAFARGDAITDITIMASVFADALRLSLTSSEKSIKNKDLTGLLRTIVQTMPTARLVQCVDVIERERRAVAGPSNPNIGLLFEAMFVELAGL